MRFDLHLDNVKRISPSYWGAVAAAAGAGAMVFSGNRILGGLALGGAMFLLALQLAPCCDGCAAGAGCGGTTATQPTPATVAPGEPGTGGLDVGNPNAGNVSGTIREAMKANAVVATRGLRVCA